MGIGKFRRKLIVIRRLLSKADILRHLVLQLLCLYDVLGHQRLTLPLLGKSLLSRFVSRSKVIDIILAFITHEHLFEERHTQVWFALVELTGGFAHLWRTLQFLEEPSMFAIVGIHVVFLGHGHTVESIGKLVGIHWSVFLDRTQLSGRSE